VPVSVHHRRPRTRAPTSLIAYPPAGALGGEHVRRVVPQSQIANRDHMRVDHDTHSSRGARQPWSTSAGSTRDSFPVRRWCVCGVLAARSGARRVRVRLGCGWWFGTRGRPASHRTVPTYLMREGAPESSLRLRVRPRIEHRQCRRWIRRSSTRSSKSVEQDKPRETAATPAARHRNPPSSAQKSSSPRVPLERCGRDHGLDDRARQMAIASATDGAMQIA
jgi:hypothetical protein